MPPPRPGDVFPNVDVWVLSPAMPDNKPRQPMAVKPLDLFKGKRRVVVVGIPGPFTPGCSKSHVPGFLEAAKELRAKGIDQVYVVSTADAFVMDAFAQSLGPLAQEQPPPIIFLADGNQALTNALGLQMDGTARGMGSRMQRFAVVVDGKGIIQDVQIDPSGQIKLSRAANVLSRL